MLSANISNLLRKSIYTRDNYRCALCDSTRGIQVHHVIPRGRGGNNSAHNLITLCWRCHAAIHGTRFPDMPEWLDQESMDLAAVEYVADLYACHGKIWNPWQKGKEGGW